MPKYVTSLLGISPYDATLWPSFNQHLCVLKINFTDLSGNPIPMNDWIMNHNIQGI